MELLDQYPDLKKISCPPSLYARISPKYLQALDELGVSVVPVAKKGRPKRYDDEEIKKIEHLLKSGHTPREISETLKMPLKTVYYLKGSPLKRGRKNKYDPQKVQKVKNLYENGVNPKEISKNLDIPLRTVYFLLKR
jgi:hypothetical protein